MRSTTKIEQGSNDLAPGAGEPSAGHQFVRLLEAALDADLQAIRQLGAQFARQYKADDRREVQGRIGHLIRRQSAPLEASRHVERLPLDQKTRMPLVEEHVWPSSPLLLEAEQEALLNRFVNEAKNAEKLYRAGLSSRYNLLLSGPPGTGKTFVAGHIAARLGLPFNVVRLDTVVSSLLGDTAKNIRSLFDYLMRGGGLLFLDEFDAVAKSRDDQRELGELKRVVNTLLQGLDMVGERSVIIAATNHSRLLDPAVWRRFPYNLEIGLPGLDLRIALWDLYLWEGRSHRSSNALGVISEGLSCSDIRELSLQARRLAVMHDEPIRLDRLTESVLRSAVGRISMQQEAEVAPEQKAELMVHLSDLFHMSHGDIGLLLGVSRQHVSATLKRRAQTSLARLESEQEPTCLTNFDQSSSTPSSP